MEGPEIRPSARAHEVPDEDMRHALNHAMAKDLLGEDPDRWLILGPDRTGNLLELVVVEEAERDVLIHAMPMRAKYRRLLP